MRIHLCFCFFFEYSFCVVVKWISSTDFLAWKQKGYFDLRNSKQIRSVSNSYLTQLIAVSIVPTSFVCSLSQITRLLSSRSLSTI